MRRVTPLVGLFSLMLAVLLPGDAVRAASVARQQTPPWRGDFETGNLSQWTWGIQQKDPSRVTVVTAPLRQGRYAGRFEVRPGDSNVGGATGERAEVLISSATSDGGEDREAYWAWSTYFPAHFTAPGGSWNVFTQFHHTGPTGQANVHFAVTDRKKLTLRVMGGDFNRPVRRDFTLMSLTRGRWYDFVFHVRWSSTGSGFVEAWVNGCKVVRKTSTPTLYAGYSVYLKQGFYRQSYDGATVVYHDGTRRGAMLAAVANWANRARPSDSRDACPVRRLRVLYELS